MTGQKLDEKAIFNVARTIESPEARAEYLRDACSGDAELIERVQTLLRGYEEQASFLESPPAAIDVGRTALLDEPISERPGTVIGPYKLLQQIGEGGMGVVFMAEQTQPLHRTVALKIIKPGMDTRQVIARFEAERQALAMMDHPNIAKVLDAGTTDSGRPYFVMELVKGIPITKYCDEKHLALRERLELFLPVCQAVQHAHQKAIIHRDIKPTNVLVAEYDNHCVPKVIDFGVAKATAQKLTERTMFTEFGQVVGTFEYMSPEQAKLNQLDIDTRSDIYALGVLLYELLTGDTPFDRKRLRSASFEEVLRIIREEEPPRPSTRLTTLGQQAASTVSAQRSSDPDQLRMLMRGELDWIVMKCLDKDRNRRYESANSLAADVGRYLKDEPVQACPPSKLYRIGKFVRRHKAALATAATFAGVLLLAMVGLAAGSVLVWRANNETRQALEQRRRLSYFQQVALAEREWAANNFTRADELLAQCPPKLRGWEWHYVKRLRGRAIAPLRHAKGVWTCAVSPDGSQIVSVDYNGDIYCWDPQTGREIRPRVHGHDVPWQAVFNADGSRFATSSWDRVKIWDARTGQQLLSWKAPRGSAQAIARSPGGGFLTCVYENDGASIWNPESERKLFRIPGAQDQAVVIALSPDEKRLAAASDDGTISIVNSRDGTLERKFHGERGFTCVAFSPDGSLVAAGSGGMAEQGSGSVRIWEIASGRERSPQSRHGTRSLTFSPDGTRLATGGTDHAVKIWDVASGQEIVTLRGHADWIRAIEFTPDGNKLISACDDCTVRIWDGTPWKHSEKYGDDVITLRGHRDSVNAVAFHPRDPLLATASTDGTIKLWNTETWREERALNPRFRTGVWDVVISPSGDRMAAIGFGRDGVVAFDMATGEIVQRLDQDDDSSLTQITFDGSGHRLAVGDEDGAATIYDVASGTVLHHLQTPSKYLYGVAFSPDDKHFAAACMDGSVRIWDSASGREIDASPLTHQRWANAVAFSPDGRLLASGGYDNTVRLWDTSIWHQSGMFVAETYTAGIAFSPDGDYIAWGTGDSAVRLFRRSTGELQTLRGHMSLVYGVSFSPHGRLIASASEDGTAKIWKVPADATVSSPAAE